MVKKVLVGTVLVGLIGALVFGAINRTMDRTGTTAEAQGQGNGRGRSSEGLATGQGNGKSRSSEELAAGQGNGRGRSAEGVDAQTGYGRGVGRNGGAERQFPNYDSIPEDWVTYEGAVVQVPEPGVELLIETSEGEQLQIGTGPMDLSAEGFTLQAGEPLHVTGYWDGDEFKATRLTRLDTGQTLALRDELGRPAWAGSGRNAQSATLPGNGTLGDQSGAGQAQVDGWHEIEGSVVHVEADTLTVLTTDGSEIVLEGRPWRFAQEQGFSAQIGDTLTLIGFYEGDEYEVGLINDATSGQAVTLRNESGRPMWAGRGRGGL